MTLKQIDELHERPDGTARRQFNANRQRFEAGRDYIDLSADEIRTQMLSGIFPAHTRNALLFTERGYGKVVKGWNDDLAWALHDAMQDAYFIVK